MPTVSALSWIFRSLGEGVMSGSLDPISFSFGDRRRLERRRVRMTVEVRAATCTALWVLTRSLLIRIEPLVVARYTYRVAPGLYRCYSTPDGE